MSKFFAGGLSDSDLSSSDEEDLYASSQSESDNTTSDESSDESSDAEGDVGGVDDESDSESDKPRGQYMRNQFLKGQGSSDSDSDSDDSDDDRKVVKSAKTKLFDEIDGAAKAVDSAVKQGDWISAVASFDKMVKSGERASRQYEAVPTSLVRTLVELESAVAARGGKKLSPSQSKAQNTIRQRLKRAQRDFESRVELYRQDPDNYKPSLTSARDTPQGTREGTPATATATEESAEGSVFKTLMSIVEMRGKKNTDRSEQVSVLENLLTTCTTAYQKISVLLMLIPIRFDLTSSGSIMPLATWQAIDADIRALFEVLEANADEYMVIESATEPEDLEMGPEPDVNGIKRIPGSVSALIERLDDEHTRALQVIDPHTTEYIDRLRDETKLYDLFLRAQAHTERNLARLNTPLAESESLCRLLVRRVDHIYYKPTTAIVTNEVEAWARVPKDLDSKITPRITSAPADEKEYTITVVNQMCSVLYKQANTTFRARAMLAVIYHYALNDYYYKARDLLLMSHLQSSISSAEPLVQVLFNRALVQVGLCAFRVGLIPEAMQSLHEICSSSRLKELLGQGPVKHGGAVAQQDRQQLLPFHMHINVELIECVYLTSSMLIEVPYLASLRNSADLKKKIISKPFRRMLDYQSRQVFSGPSENTRDHIIQAAKALQSGDWKSASELLGSIKIWNLLADSEKIKNMLRSKLQVEGLRTYLLTYGTSYGSLALSFLEIMFQLPIAQIRSLVTKMIANDEITAALDDSDNYVVFRAADLTKLQVLSQALAERAVSLAERNERLAGDGHGPEQTKKVSNRKPVRA